MHWFALCAWRWRYCANNNDLIVTIVLVLNEAVSYELSVVVNLMTSFDVPYCYWSPLCCPLALWLRAISRLAFHDYDQYICLCSGAAWWMSTYCFQDLVTWLVDWDVVGNIASNERLQDDPDTDCAVVYGLRGIRWESTVSECNYFVDNGRTAQWMSNEPSNVAMSGSHYPTRLSYLFYLLSSRHV